MYSNNILNFQESMTILNACTKKSGNLLNAPRTCMFISKWSRVLYLVTILLTDFKTNPTTTLYHTTIKVCICSRQKVETVKEINVCVWVAKKRNSYVYFTIEPDKIMKLSTVHVKDQIDLIYISCPFK